MVSAEKVMPTPWAPEHIVAMLPSVAASPWPLEGPGNVLPGALLYTLHDDNRRALIAVSPVNMERGRRLDVVGLVSLGDRLSAADTCAAIDQIAHQHQCRAVAMCTRRAHIVRACARHGWQITGMVMTKEIQ